LDIPQDFLPHVVKKVSAAGFLELSMFFFELSMILGTSVSLNVSITSGGILIFGEALQDHSSYGLNLFG